ncbi:uncharacterized protein LOC111372592, partial [Olea europaea var. sylvestris]|uniref:uncharacterized protein LOC111372592 n=1 Tax=Olea europaea var. sylvestris TaxID=158386 RepID=UPI000C1D7750
KLPSPEQVKGKKYCKWHNAWSHLTNNCLVFRHVLQDVIESGQITFEDKRKMAVDENPFPQPLGVNMVMSGFKDKFPKFKLVIDDREEEAGPHPSIFERIKGKEPKKDEDVLCARCKEKVSANAENPGIWQHHHRPNIFPNAQSGRGRASLFIPESMSLSGVLREFLEVKGDGSCLQRQIYDAIEFLPSLPAWMNSGSNVSYGGPLTVGWTVDI